MSEVDIANRDLAHSQVAKVRVFIHRDDAVTLRTFLELHPYDLPPTITASLRAGLREWDSSVEAAQRDLERAERHEVERQAKLGADIELPADDAGMCEASIPMPRVGSARCRHRAKVIRPNFDAKGDIRLCGTHRRKKHPLFRSHMA